MALSALGDKNVEPTPDALDLVLGASRAAWDHLVARMQAQYGPLTEDWRFSGAKYGWNCRLTQKKRTVLYLIPQDRAFLVGVVLGDRALGLLRRDAIGAGTRDLIDEAKRYAEGTGFRIPVASVEQCSDVEVVIEAKMA